jgi:hypothetical protein
VYCEGIKHEVLMIGLKPIIKKFHINLSLSNINKDFVN